jgi:hypothetical protein
MMMATTMTTTMTRGGVCRANVRGRGRGAARSTGPTVRASPHAVAMRVIADVAKADDSVIGPAVCVVSALYIGQVFWNGSREILAITKELEGKGYDVSAIQKLKELKFLKRAVDTGNKGEVQEAFDKIWFARAKTIAATGDIMQVRRMQEYWRKRGVRVKELRDLDDLQAFMVKKYNKKR